MIRRFVRHQVGDYATWRAVHDGFDPERRGMGVVGDAVYRGPDDGNDVTVWHDLATRVAAEAFAGSDRLQAVMHDAGVVGAPTIWFVSEA